MSETQPVANLEEANSAFASGNYARARQIALELRESEDESTRLAAQALLDQMSPAPLGKYLLLLTAALLVAVTLFSYSQ